MKPIKTALLLAALSFPEVAAASPILITICETDQGQTTAWWPSQVETADYWPELFARQGVEVISPAVLSSAPRLSPTVYGQKPMSDKNAKTMASLFGTTDVLNGTVTWDCTPVDTRISCRATATLSLITGSTTTPLSIHLQASAPDKTTAQKYLASAIASQIALPIQVRTTPQDAIPPIFSKPVVIFDPLPDADTLVALRKRLKRVQGIQDVAERYVANAMLAIELNPAEPAMSKADFDSYIQAFLAITDDNLMIRETKRSDNGIIFEVLKY